MDEKANLAEQKPDLAYPTRQQRDLGVNEASVRQRPGPLSARLRAGDRAAAVELVDEYHEQIYLFMRRLGHDRHVSEDLTQDVFFSAWHHIGQLKDDKALKSWLYRIASNVSRLYWRRHKHKEVAGIELIDMPDSSETGPEKAGRREQLEQVIDAVTRLPTKLKETIVLHYVQQLTIAEAAEVAGIREGTFKSRLNRALRTLKKTVP
ncbi:MAG: RNA polymerase sigma factor [Phycisphaerales bacterium]|nr:MAG: RNA polymerase sigma factor [Phycisphaerales bacterium]